MTRGDAYGEAARVKTATVKALNSNDTWAGSNSFSLTYYYDRRPKELVITATFSLVFAFVMILLGSWPAGQLRAMEGAANDAAPDDAKVKMRRRWRLFYCKEKDQ